MPATKPQTEVRERRAIAVTGLELRSATGTDNGRTAAGYAALFGVRSDVGGYWTEEIASGAFAKSLSEDDILALHSHDTGRVVGRTGAGTLTLREDSKGLAFENELPNTTDGNDLVVQIERRDVSGMSFGFIATKQEWDETVDPPHRTILEARLFEITYSAFPQYTETEVDLRSLEEARKSAALERKERNRMGWLARKALTEQRIRKIPGDKPEA
jgi:HK97 family phage prohead protease